jgi:hypothetical protein
VNRRAFVAGLGAALAVPLVAEAQPPGKVYRIGYLAHISDSSMPRLMEAFRESLASSGWIEGQNIIIEYRSAEGNAERLPERDLAAGRVPCAAFLSSRDRNRPQPRTIRARCAFPSSVRLTLRSPVRETPSTSTEDTPRDTPRGFSTMRS